MRNLDNVSKHDSILGGHPEKQKVNGVTTGSLGHGFPIAVGLALAAKLKKKFKTFVIVGDGEGKKDLFGRQQ